MAQKKQELENLNETGARKSDRRKKQVPTRVERRKVQRRRQIDPTTCERDYKDDEIEFMHALDEYKRASGRMFPTCSEILEVLQKLGYRKLDVSNESGSSLTESDPSVDSDEETQSGDDIESMEEVL